VPGLEPDVDFDGDGLERFVLDIDGKIESCVDGDLTVIDGPGCFQDPRIVDSFSLVLRFEAVPARLSGPIPTWWSTQYARCDGPPAAESWGACPEDRCSRWSTQTCTPSCGGEGSHRCLWDCSEWSACVPSGSETTTLDSCGGITRLEGASCEGEPPLVDLTADRAAGFQLGRGIVVGRGPVVVEARVEASLDPGSFMSGGTRLGWAIVAYVDEGSSWVGDYETGLGVAHSRLGWALEWRYLLGESTDDDELLLRALIGDDSPEIRVDSRFYSYRTGPEPALNADTEEPVLQTARLVIEPDLLDTTSNELVVTGSVLDEEGLPALSLGCFADGCATQAQVREGDTLEIGLTSAAITEHSFQIRLDGTDGPTMTIEAAGLCPE
jgi:hypothetical protein